MNHPASAAHPAATRSQYSTNVAYAECCGGTYIRSSVFCTSIGLAERSTTIDIRDTRMIQIE